MKKFLIFVFLFAPSLVFAVPTVRTLGNNSSIGTSKLASGTINKVTPTKSSSQTGKQNSNVATISRLGTIRSKSNTSNSGIKNTNSRFPTISTVSSYNSVVTPKPDTSTSEVISSNTDLRTIVNAVMQKVDQDYYNKTDVYTTTAFENAVKDTVKDNMGGVYDPRFDAIRVGFPDPEHRVNMPTGYVFMWVEP